MAKLIDSRFGESVIMKLRGTTREGLNLSELKRGRWVIFYSEIPGVSLGDGKFLIYPNAQKECIEKLENGEHRSTLFNFLPEEHKSCVQKNNRSWYEQCMRTHKRMHERY